MQENKYILTSVTEHVAIYELTSSGKKALELVKDLIPGILRFNIDNNFKETLVNIENELSVSANFVPQGKNGYSVTCKIVENGSSVFEVKAFAGSSEHAQKIASNWKQNAEELYPKILDILTKDL